MAIPDPYNANDPRKKDELLRRSGGGAGGGGGGGYGGTPNVRPAPRDMQGVRSGVTTHHSRYRTDPGNVTGPSVALQGSVGSRVTGTDDKGRTVYTDQINPEGVSKRSDGLFESKGNFGERAFSDSAYAPQFAGVAGASPEKRAAYDVRFGQDRSKGNIATDADAFEVQRRAELQRAGEDYKAYVAAGSPRGADGRGLTEYDFLQNQRQNSLGGFLEGNVDRRGGGRIAGSLGGRGSDNGRDPQQADFIAANEALGNDVKTKQSIALQDEAINEAVQGRPDKLLASFEDQYTKDPDLAKRTYGAGATPRQAALIDAAKALARRDIDPRTVDAGKEGVAIYARLVNDYYNNKRGLFDSGRGKTEGTPSLSGFEVQKRDLGFFGKLFGKDPYEIQGPAYDRRSEGSTLAPIDPNDPNAERTRVGYDPSAPGFGDDDVEFLQRIKEFDKKRQ